MLDMMAICKFWFIDKNVIKMLTVTGHVEKDWENENVCHWQPFEKKHFWEKY